MGCTCFSFAIFARNVASTKKCTDFNCPGIHVTLSVVLFAFSSHYIM